MTCQNYTVNQQGDTIHLATTTHAHTCRNESKLGQIYTTSCQTEKDVSVAPAGLWFGAFICGVFSRGHRSQVNQTTA